MINCPCFKGGKSANDLASLKAELKLAWHTMPIKNCRAELQSNFEVELDEDDEVMFKMVECKSEGIDQHQYVLWFVVSLRGFSAIFVSTRGESLTGLKKKMNR